MLTQVSALLFSCVLLWPGDLWSKADLQSSYEDSDAYEVYAAILPSEWTLRVAHAKRLVFTQETRPYEMCLRPAEGEQSLYESAIADYISVNKTKWRLGNHFIIEQPYEIVSRDSLTSLAWKDFYRKYPESGGWIELSAVGFNPEKTVAVVYVGHHCGNLCAGGHFQVLLKKNGKWAPIEWKGIACAWAS
ncbi:MAG TPA: hypothetical protein VKM94_00570 [Blastocatellia bacterium]|nr:hypothetical protein [Blastocatellia bacterium]